MYYNAGGGGGGASAIALLDLAQQPSFNLSVGSGGAGGKGGEISIDTSMPSKISNGRNGGNTSISNGDYYINAQGGGGGQSYAGMDIALGYCKGGSGGVCTQNEGGGITVLATQSGGAGGGGDSAGSNAGSITATYGSASIFNNASYASGDHTGDSNKRGGGASPHGNGNSTGAGSGGRGGAANLVEYHDGASGSSGFIKIFY